MARDGTKTGGRQKGTPNKTSATLKNLVVDFISENWEQVQKDFSSENLHPRNRLMFLEKLLKYAIPIMGANNTKLELKKQLENLNDADLDKLVQKVIEEQENNTEDEQE